MQTSVDLDQHLSARLGKGYFTILRLYSPTEAYLDGTWKANDLEEIH
jgi:hypothetical protein